MRSAESEQIHAARRLLEHHAAGTTDSAQDVMEVPVSKYYDAERFDIEMERIFKTVPLPLAMSAELREPNSFKAFEPLGIPVLITRGADGVARAFLNVCRHRGAIVAPAGCGSARRHTCPYHGWVYDTAGALVGVYGEKSFGTLDKSEHGLVALPCDERAGLIFVTLRPGRGLDIDEWLGEYADELESLKLAELHVHMSKEQESPAWKASYDGYLEGYHFANLHRTTIGEIAISNLMAWDAFGPHQRIVFARPSLSDLRQQSEDQWDLSLHLTPVHTVFPCLSISGAWLPRTAVSLLLPGPTPDRSRTAQTFLSRAPITDDNREQMDTYCNFIFDVVREEDYPQGFDITRALRSGANEHFTFGRNEPGNQHFHRWLDKLVDDGEWTHVAASA